MIAGPSIKTDRNAEKPGPRSSHQYQLLWLQAKGNLQSGAMQECQTLCPWRHHQRTRDTEDLSLKLVHESDSRGEQLKSRLRLLALPAGIEEARNIKIPPEQELLDCIAEGLVHQDRLDAIAQGHLQSRPKEYPMAERQNLRGGFGLVM